MTTHHAPPRLARRLLERAVPEGPARDGLVGDLHELYLERRRRRGRLSADAWYWWEACSAGLWYRLAAVSSDGPGTADTLPPEEGRGGGLPSGPTPWAPWAPWTAWTRLRSELRPAVRRLLRSPVFTAAATLPLTIGIGATATIFTLLHDVVLAPLPYPDSERLVVVRHLLPGFQNEGDVPEVGAFLGQYLHYRERSRRVTEMGAYWTFDGTFAGERGAEYLRLGGATAGLLRALGVGPVEGRLFKDDEPWPQGGGQGVTLLSHDFWTERYGGAPSAVGRRVTAQGWSYEVVGVLPPGLVLGQGRPVLWHAIPDGQARDNPQWTVPALVGRLAPGATADELQRELAALAAELPERYPDATNIRNAVERGRMTPRVTSLKEWVVGDFDRAMWLLLAAVALLLVVALGNVAGLFTVRTDAARRELAVRLALGSGRSGLALRTVAETAILVGTAAVLGLWIATVGVEALGRLAPVEIPGGAPVAVGWTEVALVAVIGVLASAALVGLQLLQIRGVLAGTLTDAGHGAASGPPRLRLRHAFVTLQIALSVVLLVGGGLILRSAWSLGRVDPGFQVDDLLAFRVVFPFAEIASGAASDGAATAFYQELAGRLEGTSGVEAIGWASCVPLSTVCGSGGFPIRPPEGSDPDAEHPVAGFQWVSPGYRRALGIPLLAGRDLEPRDLHSTDQRVLVSESLARRLWPDRSPLGRTFTPSAFGTAAEPEPFTVVGVVRDVHFDGLRGAAGPMVYAAAQRDVGMASFALRTPLPPLSLLESVRRTVSDVRSDVPVAFAETMEAAVARETAPMRLSSLLVMLAAGATLLLSALGVYGTVAYVVGLRRTEFGIRLALGAQGRQLGRMVLAQGLSATGVGVAGGLLGAVAASRLLRSLVFGVDPTDPATYAFAAGALLLIATGAAWLPARRASRIEPSEVLRDTPRA